MSTLTIRDLDPAIEDRLRACAARNNRSMEAESRAILAEAVVAPLPPPERNLYDQIRAHIEPLGGIDLNASARTPSREPPTVARASDLWMAHPFNTSILLKVIKPWPAKRVTANAL